MTKFQDRLLLLEDRMNPIFWPILDFYVHLTDITDAYMNAKTGILIEFPCIWPFKCKKELNLQREIFHLHTEFMISWIASEINDFTCGKL